MPRLTRQQQQELSRRALLESAVEVFAEHGFHGATLEAITENAGLSRGAFYSNFSSKEELFLEMFLMRTNERIAKSCEAPPNPDDIVAGARAVGKHWSRIVADDPSWVLLLLEFWTYAARTPAVREEFAVIGHRVRQHVAELITDRTAAAGALLPVPANALGAGMIGLAAGVALQELADPGRVQPDLFEQMLVLIARGMTEGAPPRAQQLPEPTP